MFKVTIPILGEVKVSFHYQTRIESYSSLGHEHVKMIQAHKNYDVVSGIKTIFPYKQITTICSITRNNPDWPDKSTDKYQVLAMGSSHYKNENTCKFSKAFNRRVALAKAVAKLKKRNPELRWLVGWKAKCCDSKTKSIWDVYFSLHNDGIVSCLSIKV